MTGLLLTLMLSVTPAECKADPEWCACRRYIAVELNRCEIAANNSKVWGMINVYILNCLARYEEGKMACLKNDGDLYPEKR